MSWYYGTYTCGHDGNEKIIGPSRGREKIAEKRFKQICPECYKIELKKIYDQKNKEAELDSEKMELPKLLGTEKQVNWANTLRLNYLNELQRCIDDAENDPISKRDIKIDLKIGGIELREDIVLLLNNLMQYLIDNKISASYWINNRYKTINDIDILVKEYYNYIDIKKLQVPDEIKIESTVMPKNVVYPGVVDITGDDIQLCASYNKNEEFHIVVKQFSLIWDNGVWKRELNEYTGGFTDRAAELGNALLQKGFTIRIYDQKALEKAVSGEFNQECRKWIKFREKSNKLAINWDKHCENSDRIYNASRQLPTAKWDSPSTVVDLEYYEEVLEFADCFDFKISKKAQTVINAYLDSIGLIAKCQPSIPKLPEDTDKLKKLLESSGVILEDLQDS